jgi:hypothetical protein
MCCAPPPSSMQDAVAVHDSMQDAVAACFPPLEKIYAGQAIESPYPKMLISSFKATFSKLIALIYERATKLAWDN